MDISEKIRRVVAEQKRQARIEYIEDLQIKEMKMNLAHIKKNERRSNFAIAISILSIILSLLQLIR